MSNKDRPFKLWYSVENCGDGSPKGKFSDFATKTKQYLISELAVK